MMAVALVVAIVAALLAARGVFASARGLAVRWLVVAGNLLAVMLAAWLVTAAAGGTGGDEVVMVTAGAGPLRPGPGVYKAIDILDLDGAATAAPPTGPAAALESNGPDGIVRVEGWGLSREHWRGIETMSRLRFAPAQGAGGIQELAWPRRVREGSAVVISGRLAGVARGRIRAALGERELGVTATAGDGRFALEFIAPVTGRYEIDLSVIGEADEPVDRGIVPLEVAPSPRLQVLGLASSPSFGWRFFQNWLTDRDAGLVLRTRVSSEHFVEQRRNMDVSGANLSADAIDAFDIVVADLAAWRELPAAQRDLVVQAVRTDGLGLLLLAGGAAFSEGGADNVPAPRLTAAPAAPQSRLLGAEVGPLPVLDLPAFGVAESVPLWQREDGIAVAGFVETGRGRIGLALRIPVYRWVTSGDARAFSLYWQRMLAAVARPKAADGRLRTSADMPYVDLRLELCLNGAVNPEMALEGPGLAGAALAMYRRPGEWCAVTWPRAAGWHRVRAGDRIHHFYVFAAREWLGVQSSERIAATRAMTEDRSAIVAVAGWRPSPPLGFGALIAIMGLLWWEQKRRPMALVKPASDGA